MEEQRIFITQEEAMSVLPEGEDIHTFINSGGMLIGADWSRQNVEERLRNSVKIEIAGGVARNMGHGIVSYLQNAKYQGDLLFISHDEDRLKALEEKYEKQHDSR